MALALTGLDVLPQDPDVLVPVRATLLVVEAEGVEQFMLNCVVVDAALTAQRQLLTIADAADVGVTAVSKQVHQRGRKQILIRKQRILRILPNILLIDNQPHSWSLSQLLCSISLDC